MNSSLFVMILNYIKDFCIFGDQIFVLFVRK